MVEKTYLIYKLTRDDGMLYIGTTDSTRFKNRMCQHRGTSRFVGHTFSTEILAENAEIAILLQEADFITQYNTLSPFGLNLTKSGKGSGHDSLHFTTRGYKFSEESRKRMSESAKRRCKTNPRLGWSHSEETKTHWSKRRKGIHARALKGKTIDEFCSQSTL
jgi:alpha-D-ribose 1-methylphosphonate 5-triphosphate synthase subunit PhnI